MLCHDITRGLRVDAVEDLTCALVGWRGLYGGDDVIVVKVLRTEQIDVRSALVTLGGAVATIEAVTAVLTF